MISSSQLINKLKKNNVNFFSGVPDSCTLELSKIASKDKKVENIVVASEGLGISMGIGYYLATNKLPCVYLQNSGLGNATDPLTNLSNKEIFKIPLILFIGWRGAPGVKDEPQHIIQGKILKNTLSNMNIKFENIEDVKDLKKIDKLIKYAKTNLRTVAFLIKSKVLIQNKKLLSLPKRNLKRDLKRYQVLEILLKSLKQETIISSVGYNSREILQIKKKNSINNKFFPLIGGMGHTSALAMSYNHFSKEKTICIDGDGSFFMHLGAFLNLNQIKNKNFKYLLFNNESHESIGGKQIDSKHIKFKKIFEGFGFKKYIFSNSLKSFKKNLKIFLKNNNGPIAWQINIGKGTFPNLIRPTKSDLEMIRKQFQK